MKALFLFLAVVFLLACGVSSEQLTATAVAAQAQTQTAAPTLTPTKTLTPTVTPKPTSTPTNTPEPTPVVVGETVKWDFLEITLLEVLTHHEIIIYTHYYTAKDGYVIVDVMVRVRNQEDAAMSATLGEMYVVEEDGKAWLPFCGGSRTVELEKSFNPMTIIRWDMNFETATVTFESKKDTYLRLMWPVHHDQDLIFGIQDSPQFTFSVK